MKNLSGFLLHTAHCPLLVPLSYIDWLLLQIANRSSEFNARYNPLHLSFLRRIFLTSDNNTDGRYFADILKVQQRATQQQIIMAWFLALSDCPH